MQETSNLDPGTYLVKEPFTAFVQVGRAGSNVSVGNSNVPRFVYAEVELQRGDIIHQSRQEMTTVRHEGFRFHAAMDICKASYLEQKYHSLHHKWPLEKLESIRGVDLPGAENFNLRTWPRDASKFMKLIGHDLLTDGLFDALARSPTG